MTVLEKLRNTIGLAIVLVVFSINIAIADEEIRRVGVVVVETNGNRSGYMVSVNNRTSVGPAKIMRALSGLYVDDNDYLAILVQEDVALSHLSEVIMMAAKVGFKKRNIYLFAFEKKVFMLSLSSYDTYRYTTNPEEIRNYLMKECLLSLGFFQRKIIKRQQIDGSSNRGS